MVFSKRFEEEKINEKRKEIKSLEETIQNAERLISTSKRRLEELGSEED